MRTLSVIHYRKYSLIFLLLFPISLLFFGCNRPPSSRKLDEKRAKNENIPFVKVVENQEPSITQTEASQKLYLFLKMKSISQQQIQKINTQSGDYNGDGELEYFFTVFFQSNTHLAPTNYYYNSKAKAITELHVNYRPQTTDLSNLVIYVEPRIIEYGTLIGTITMATDAGTQKYDIVTPINAKYSIYKTQILFSHHLLPKLKNAEVELVSVLKEITATTRTGK